MPASFSPRISLCLIASNFSFAFFHLWLFLHTCAPSLSCLSCWVCMLCRHWCSEIKIVLQCNQRFRCRSGCLIIPAVTAVITPLPCYNACSWTLRTDNSQKERASMTCGKQQVIMVCCISHTVFSHWPWKSHQYWMLLLSFILSVEHRARTLSWVFLFSSK